MTMIVSIVEGHGEVKALRILLRRIAESHGIYDLEVPEPIRVQKDRFLRRPEEFERVLALASAKADVRGSVLIVVDDDDDCPVTLAGRIRRSAGALSSDRHVAVVVANREFEAWLLAGASSLAGKRGLAQDLAPPGNPDAIRDAKGWLSQRMGSSRYHEVLDQPALTAVFDIDAAKQISRSLRKLVETVEALLIQRA